MLQLADPRMPMFVVIPLCVVESCSLSSNNIVEIIIDGYETGLNTLKRMTRSDTSDWFVELTLPFCRIANIKVGDTVDVLIKVAAGDFPSKF